MQKLDVTYIRTKVREIVQWWFWFKCVKIYGNDLHKTVKLSRTTIIDKANPRGVHIGENTYLAGGAIVFAHDFARAYHGQTHIGKNCFIGANAIIMCGVTIGDEVIVGAGAIVTHDVPSNSIVVGNPAKVIRTGIHTVRYGQLVEEDR